jgi:uncharacterized protein (DUF111 family)
MKLVKTRYGTVRVKVSRHGGDIIKATPEYEDCRRIAKKLRIPLLEIIKAVKVKP